MITGKGQPEQVAGVAPAIEDDSLSKRLAFGRDNDTIMFSPASGTGFRPMQLESPEFQRIELDE
jgi:hypothetical protein